MEPTTRVHRSELTDLRRRRAELRESMGLLEDALAAPAGALTEQWWQRVHDALTDVSDDFIDHVVVTEGPDGLHHAIVSADLRLANAVENLAAEHPSISAEIAGLVAFSAVVDSDRVDDVRERATNLLARLARHRQRGADLIYEAYQTDIGGGD